MNTTEKLAAALRAANENTLQCINAHINAYGDGVWRSEDRKLAVLREELRQGEEAIAQFDAERQQAAGAAPESKVNHGDSNGRNDEARPTGDGCLVISSSSRRPLLAGDDSSLTDALWSSGEVMSLNAELGLSMGQLARLARSLLAALQQPAPEAHCKYCGGSGEELEA